ncbi:esterase-like activity of phytase family protein [Rhizobium sp. TH2]|uniref:esterase-like activity of phytase family protein n=1 Tax=Rhizobium sp. TH2 TaxID=2775403 RepID=UPI0021588AFA|nr:esterase-like activity of phytase family protein [Rhizobium sp. TH2]UVC09159.1 esterase-like activity of phytase family protein [Rhizobium sp. TH2]
MAVKKRWTIAAFLPFVLFAAFFPAAFGGQPARVDGEVISVKSLVIDEFKRGTGKRFGELEYLGGLVMATKNGEMGAVSSIRILPDLKHFISIMDTGHWAVGEFERDAGGRLSGIGDYKIYSMVGSASRKSKDHKDNLDAEGMVIAGGHIYVSFERDHRIAAFPLEGFETAKPVEIEKPVLDKGYKLRSNGGMEAVLKSPSNGPLEGALVYVSERSYNDQGNFISGVQSGPRKGTFFVERIGAYDVTDGVFLKDGTFLLLERKFGLKDGIGMRIRRFDGKDIESGKTISGSIVMEADFSHQIDNMEGLDAFPAADGSTHLIVTSDDNHSLLERNLLLEFKLLE